MRARITGTPSIEAAFVLEDLANSSIDFHGPDLGGSPTEDTSVRLGLCKRNPK